MVLNGKFELDIFEFSNLLVANFYRCVGITSTIDSKIVTVLLLFVTFYYLYSSFPSSSIITRKLAVSDGWISVG